jgi:hypothetical protein
MIIGGEKKHVKTGTFYFWNTGDVGDQFISIFRRGTP